MKRWTLNPSCFIRGRNKSSLLSLLFYRLPSKSFRPLEQTIPTAMRGGWSRGIAISSTASLAPSSTAGCLQLCPGRRNEKTQWEEAHIASVGSYVLRAFIYQMPRLFPCLLSFPTPQHLYYYCSATSDAIEPVLLWQVSWQIFRH